MHTATTVSLAVLCVLMLARLIRSTRLLVENEQEIDSLHGKINVIEAVKRKAFEDVERLRDEIDRQCRAVDALRVENGDLQDELANLSAFKQSLSPAGGFEIDGETHRLFRMPADCDGFGAGDNVATDCGGRGRITEIDRLGFATVEMQNGDERTVFCSRLIAVQEGD